MTLERIKLFVLDMDGTFYLGNRVFPSSLVFADRIRKTGRKYVFLTNNSSKGPEEYAEKLKKMGVNVGKDDIFTSGEATAMYILKEYGRSRIFLLGTFSLSKIFENFGHLIVEDDPQMVVLGFDTTLTYEKLKKACLLLRKGLLYIATHPDINCPSEEGLIPDAGSFISAIKASTGREPDFIVGKPNPMMIEMLLNRYGFTKDQVAIVGDRLYTDIKLGKNSNILTILVLTGETTLEDLKNSDVKPDLVVRDLGEIAKIL